MGIRVGEKIAFFTIVRQDDGSSVVKWLSPESQKNMNKELDIFCDNGTIYRVGYTNDED